jgi:hypothetical protein
VTPPAGRMVAPSHESRAVAARRVGGRGPALALHDASDTVRRTKSFKLSSESGVANRATCQ